MSSAFPPCAGNLVPLIEGESSYRCTLCLWSGWPRQLVQPHTGRILRRWPHRYTWYADLHEVATWA